MFACVCLSLLSESSSRIHGKGGYCEYSLPAGERTLDFNPDNASFYQLGHSRLSPPASHVATEWFDRIQASRESRMKHKATFIFLSLTVYGVIGSPDYFWHFTDVHYDPTYRTTQESCIVNFNDSTPPPFGSYECDSPWRLVASSVDAMKQIGPTPAFIVWSGDTVHHPKNPKDLSREKVYAIMKNVTDLLQAMFPGVLVLPCVGNHDYFPDDQLPPRDDVYYGGLADLWRPWLGAGDAAHTFTQGGYYTLMLRAQSKVRAVVLNTNLYNTGNHVPNMGKDPAGQLAWFDNVLANATANGEKVHVIFHVTPGYLDIFPIYWFRPEFNAVFSDLIRRHASVVVGIYSGHAHTDSFRLIYKNGKAVASVLVAPPVAPLHTRNPGVRRVMMTKDYTRLLDVEQYYLPLTEANKRGLAEWKLEYSFRQNYELKDASTASLQALLDEFKQPSSKHFEQYHKFNSVNAQTKSNMPCDSPNHSSASCACSCGVIAN
ncbi:Acid sphingomyelinase-like phosphodiesterase 3a [Lamellibrachia satsuma]|nr:Acid sphingomyelinase-like phosphodiesterase 3a [Lamellibrachia satsuma]